MRGVKTCAEHEEWRGEEEETAERSIVKQYVVLTAGAIGAQRQIEKRACSLNNMKHISLMISRGKHNSNACIYIIRQARALGTQQARDRCY